MSERVDRRTVLRAGTAGLAAALAGCGGAAEDTPEFLPEVGGGSESQQVPAEIERFLTSEPAAPNYDGSMYIADAVKTDFVNVYVGEQTEGGAPTFEPAAIQLPPGSTVRWNWVAGTGDHAVQSTAASAYALDSGEPTVDREDYQVSFPEEGLAFYECPVHAGMKGAIVVTADPY